MGEEGIKGRRTKWKRRLREEGVVGEEEVEEEEDEDKEHDTQKEELRRVGRTKSRK